MFDRAVKPCDDGVLPMKFPFELNENKRFDCVGFGTNAVDYLIQVAEYPPLYSKIELENYTLLAGGEIASTMAGLKRLQMETAYIGRFGDDKEGDFGLRTLIDEGVNVEYAEQIAGATTQIGFIIIDMSNGERTVIWKRDQKLAYTPDEVPLDFVRDAKIFHATPHDALACARMAREAKAHGAIVSIDIDNLFDGVSEMIPLVDVFLASAEFPEKLLGIKDKKAALREIKSRFGCPIVGVTLGASGSLILCEGSFIETGGFEVPNGCVDTTGAGDAFRVGFLYGILKGASIEEAARMANVVAALKCRQLGARTALPFEKELAEMLASAPLKT